MNKRKIALGPGAASLILIVVVLSLCMLAMLTQIAAKNDYNLCTRSAEMVQKVYELNAQSEQNFAKLDSVLVSARKEAMDMQAYLDKVKELLPEGMALDEDRVTWTEPLDNRNLECIVQLLPIEDTQRAKWISHKLAVEEPEDDWEW
ncbi:hypothetical protein [Aristaeella hokkaidonensis]|uniref:Uncharacterized protein n=1 Tax=Aristaeella hokkaidonensis TaxID=3046382 RepID=A0AC61MZ06_9FIRM|nr:hypothetical protein [Aristaeella hokkaidonensis]QUC68457.1 hypothetical protein JYE49_07145 [Aristaeella hokkaidonensis]SNT94928.1 hypothetical protein SAMN06297421_10821 [Aristaeella hokkaidonensis]